MKKHLCSLPCLAAIATTLLFSCSKDNAPVAGSPTDNATQTVHFSTAPVTRTTFGEQQDGKIPTLWTKDDTIAISLNMADFVTSKKITLGADGRTAEFDAELTDDMSGNYTFYAISPASALIERNDPGTLTSLSRAAFSEVLEINIPTYQTPGENSVDPKAQILYAADTLVQESLPTSVGLKFKHATAYGRLSLKNFTPDEGEQVYEISLQAPFALSGKAIMFTAGEFTGGISVSDEVIHISTSKTEGIWFACAPIPAPFDENSILNMTVKTHAGDHDNIYVKTITLPEGKNLLAGHVAEFSINMNGIVPTSKPVISTSKETDLGLSVIWAGYNVGAESPEENGDFFAWGETLSKDYYAPGNYTLCRSFGLRQEYLKYNDEDSKTTLEATDDAATHNWGSEWRTPTSNEMSELLNFCDWEWTTYKGKKGYMVSGTTNTAIFLPANGHKSYDIHESDGQQGSYWSSSLAAKPATVAAAESLIFDGKDGTLEVDSFYRYSGYAVRAVKTRSDF